MGLGHVVNLDLERRLGSPVLLATDRSPELGCLDNALCLRLGTLALESHHESTSLEHLHESDDDVGLLLDERPDALLDLTAVDAFLEVQDETSRVVSLGLPGLVASFLLAGDSCPSHVVAVSIIMIITAP